MTDQLELSGSMVALVTPLANGEVDYISMGKLIDHQIESGTQGLVPCGTTGESPTLTHEEQDKIIEFTCKRAAGRVPVIAGTGSNSTAEAVRLTRKARDAGADACLIVNPYYNKPTQEGMYAHVAKLAEVGLPIVLYNIPGRCGVALEPETIARMYEEIDPVIAVKEATGQLDVSSTIASLCDITILSGDDSLTLPICSVGGKGVVSVVANVLPAEVRKLCDAIAADDLNAARDQHHRLFPLFRAMLKMATNPIPIKAAIGMTGWARNELRLPMTPLGEPDRQELAEMLKELGLKVKTDK